MIQNLLICSIALVGLAASSYGVLPSSGVQSYPYYPQFNPYYGGYGGWDHRHNHHHRRPHYRQNTCKPIKAFTPVNATANETLPKIDYFYHNGIEQAIIVCDAPQQIQAIAAYASDANVNSNSYKNFSIISVSSNSGIVLKCDKKTRTFKAYNYISQNAVTVQSVKCFSATDAEIAAAVAGASAEFAQ